MKEAITIAYLRGQVISQNNHDGSMLAVGIAESELHLDLKDHLESVTIACYNSPESITLSGSTGDIMTVKAELEANNRFVRILATDGNAYHSPHMKPLGPKYEEEIQRSCQSIPEPTETLPEGRFISSVTGKTCTRKDLGAKYWRLNLESQVLFKQAIEELARTAPVDVLIEIGPHSALRGPIKQTAKSITNVRFPQYIPTLIRGEDGVTNILCTAGELFSTGYKVDIGRVNAVEVVKPKPDIAFDLQNGSLLPELPRYQWEYEKTLFTENRWTREWRLRTHSRHDILGSRIPGGTKSHPTWRNILRPRDVLWMEDHRVSLLSEPFSTTLMP